MAALTAALTTGCGEAESSASSPSGGTSTGPTIGSSTPAPSVTTTPPDDDVIELDTATAARQLQEADDEMTRLDAVTITIHDDQGSWDLPIPMLTEIYWVPATGDFHSSSRADDPQGDAMLEYLHVEDRYYARWRMIDGPPTKWSDLTDTTEKDESDVEKDWNAALGDFEPMDAEQAGTTTTIHGSLPSSIAIDLLGTDFAGSLPEEVYEGTTAVTIVIEDGLPQSVSFSGKDVDLAKVDTAGVMGDMLAGLRAAKYRVEYAEGDPAEALTAPSPDEISPVSAFS
jgi:hypothetical protein